VAPVAPSEAAGNWVIATCPMSSEAFADTPEAVLAAWETNGQVFFTRVDKQKHRLSNPIAAPGSGAGRKHPALAVNGKGENAARLGRGDRLGARRVFDDRGKPTKSRGKADGIPVWSFATAFVNPRGEFVVVF